MSTMTTMTMKMTTTKATTMVLIAAGMYREEMHRMRWNLNLLPYTMIRSRNNNVGGRQPLLTKDNASKSTHDLHTGLIFKTHLDNWS